jgi:hypothetical protein
MEASAAPAGRVSAGKVISETFSIYGQNLGALIGSAFVVFLIVGVAAGLLDAAGGIILNLLAAAIRLAGYALFTGFVVRLVQDVRADGQRDQTVGDLLSAATPAIGALIVFGILFAIGVTVGLVLLIVPGLILLTIWCVGAPAIVVEQMGAIDAFGRSRDLVRGEGWSVFATLILVLLIVILIGIVFAIIATPISDEATVVASIISNIVTGPIFAVALSVIFFDLGGGSGAAVEAPEQLA